MGDDGGARHLGRGESGQGEQPDGGQHAARSERGDADAAREPEEGQQDEGPGVQISHGAASG